MNALAQVLWDPQGDLLGDYAGFVDAIEVSPAQRSQRKAAARRFLERHADPAVWMASRSTAARLVDLHRLKAWPWLTWLMVEPSGPARPGAAVGQTARRRCRAVVDCGV